MANSSGLHAHYENFNNHVGNGTNALFVSESKFSPADVVEVLQSTPDACMRQFIKLQCLRLSTSEAVVACVFANFGLLPEDVAAIYVSSWNCVQFSCNMATAIKYSMFSIELLREFLVLMISGKANVGDQIFLAVSARTIQMAQLCENHGALRCVDTWPSCCDERPWSNEFFASLFVLCKDDLSRNKLASETAAITDNLLLYRLLSENDQKICEDIIRTNGLEAKTIRAHVSKEADLYSSK